MKKAPYYDTYWEAGPRNIPLDATHIYRIPTEKGRVLVRPLKQEKSHILFVDLETGKKYRISKKSLEERLVDGTITALT